MTNKSDTYKTTCSYCGVGCGIIIRKSPLGKLSIEGDKDNPVNKGMLCSKGRNLLYVVEDQSDRLTHPQYRNSITDSFEDKSWEEIFEITSSKIKHVIAEHGPNSIGFYVSGQCLSEEYYIANKLVKGFIGTNNIDTNSRLCMSSAVMGYKLSLGEDCVPASYDDIELADCFLISGANPAWCHPILFRRLEKLKQDKPHVTFIVIDPRVTDTCSIADIHLQLKAGTDIALTNALAKVLITENLIDTDFVSKHTTGSTKLIESLENQDLHELAQTCEIEVDTIKKVARLIGRSKGFISMWAMGLNQSTEGVNKNLSLINLSLLTGQIGKPGAGPLSLTGQPNAMGGREVGGMATLLAAHHDLANPEHRIKIQNYWGGKKISEKPGFTATEMIAALESGKLKVLWIICTNPLVSLPNLFRTEEAIKKAEMIIVQDISKRSDTIDFAHVLLPAAGWLEKEGTMTNSDRRVSHLSKAVSPPGNAKADTEILCEFAKKMNFSGFDYSSSEEIFNEYKQLTSGTNIDISALSYGQLKLEGAKQWPVTSSSPNGTPRLFTSGEFFTKDKKAVLHSVQANKINPPKPEDLTLTLTTGRVRDQWHTMTRTGKVQKLNVHIGEPLLSIHPKDAELRNIKNKDMLRVENEYGYIELACQIDESLKPGLVFTPMHWGKIAGKTHARANNLTSSLIDPISKQPEYKYSTVKIKKLSPPTQEIAIIGSGAAAFSFISQHRKNNKKDKIVVYSKEEHAFYNRIQLPDYITENKDWIELLKANKSELLALDVEIKYNTTICQINKETRSISDQYKNNYSYDKLIIATGSSPIVPENLNINASGIFTIRSRMDADTIQNYIHTNAIRTATVIGGGILGLEMADVLNQLNLNTTLLVRGSKLMNKQLDATAAKLLALEIRDKGIDVQFNKSVENIAYNKRTKCINIRTKDKSEHSSDIVILAIGTSPNIDLAQSAGLDSNMGIVVNEFMQTSSKDIFAIGEIAEFNQKRYGITLASEEQAHACANFFAGNYIKHYRGTVSLNILKCQGVKLASIGDVENEDLDIEEVVLLDSTKRFYKKCLVKQDKLIGAILLGDTSELNKYKELIAKQTELGEERDKLLRNADTSEPILGNLVCSCNQVGRGNIENYINKGITDVESLMLASKAGTGCGSCKPELKKILEARQLISS